ACEEKRQEAERRRVGPVRVVDDHQEGLPAGEVGAHPVEAVQDRERRIDDRRERSLQGGRPREPEQRGCNSGGCLQQLGTRGVGGLWERRLAELPYDAEGELALELGAA